MKCPECSNAVAVGAVNCPTCGIPLGPRCIRCRTVNRPTGRFCSACGQALNDSGTKDLLSAPFPHAGRKIPSTTSERKWVTVLFSDLCGYSTLCERLDPEDVREMMNQVFKKIVGIIVRYEGYIDRIIGDEVLAVFGIPHIHEDDPVRAVRAAMEIHKAVPAMTQRFKHQLPEPLAMHSGIASGMVLTDATDLKLGRSGLTGDTVNQASMLTDLADAGEIFVEGDTMAATSGFFDFEKRDGGEKPLSQKMEGVYRVIAMAQRPQKIRRLQGLQSRLIGRSGQMSRLHRNLAQVGRKRGGCVLLKGEAGTGKSRLISEFKKGLDGRRVQWLQGNAYAYSQNMPYLPVIDLLKRAVSVRVEDTQAVVRKKLADSLAAFWKTSAELPQIIERLFTLSDANALPIPPESWKVQLKQTLIRMIAKQANNQRIVICIEDLHWADPSTVSLLINIINEADLPVLFLISGRPETLTVDLDQITNPYYRTEVIQLDDLSPDKGEEMAQSLLRSDQVPPALLTFITDRLSGNPFFLEEVINSLVDAETLIKENGRWKIRGAIAETAFASGISPVIAARLDRLGDTAKRIVQEAAVIGREFSAKVLKQISSRPTRVDHSLALVQSVGLIQVCDNASESRYQFKHSLVQEVAYNSLLKQQRSDLHEKIARTLERQHPDRTDALCETLAFHYCNSSCTDKAIEYLQHSGRKGVKKFAVVESHNYYLKAYQLLMERGATHAQAPHHIVALLLEWFFVFNMRGQYSDALTLMEKHAPDAMEKVDLRLKGMYLVCLGWAHQRREQLNTSRHFLLEALAIGERIRNYKVIAYSCAFLIWTCTDLGRFDEALAFAAKAEEASRFFESEDPDWSFEMDQDLVRFVLTGTAITHWFRGECRQCGNLGNRLLDYGNTTGDLNSASEGYLAHGMARFAAGDYRATVEYCEKAIERSSDPLYTFNARFLMAYAYLAMEEIVRAETHLDKIMHFCETSGYEYIGSSAKALSSVVAVAKGRLHAGVKAIDRHANQLIAEGKIYHGQTFLFILGRIYLKLALREGKLDRLKVVRNLPFLIVNLPQAAKKAEAYMRSAIQIADRIHARGIKGQALFELGRLYQFTGRHDQAVAVIKESFALFEQLGADKHMERARIALVQQSPEHTRLG